MEPVQTIETTEAHGGEHSKVFPPFNTSTFPSQLLWLAISFGLLYMLMSKLVLPRLSSILGERRGRILSDLDMAQAMKTETELAIASYDKALNDARGRAAAMAQEVRDQLKTEMDAERSKVEASLAAQIAEAETSIKASRDKAMQDVESIAGQAAEAIVTQLIGTADDSGISGAVKSALKKTA